MVEKNVKESCEFLYSLELHHDLRAYLLVFQENLKRIDASTLKEIEVYKRMLLAQEKVKEVLEALEGRI